MDPIFILVPVVLGIGAVYFLVTRRVKNRPHDLRDDVHERPELTGTEQHKKRETR